MEHKNTTHLYDTKGMDPTVAPTIYPLVLLAGGLATDSAAYPHMLPSSDRMISSAQQMLTDSANEAKVFRFVVTQWNKLTAAGAFAILAFADDKVRLGVGLACCAMAVVNSVTEFRKLNDSYRRLAVAVRSMFDEYKDSPAVPAAPAETAAQSNVKRGMFAVEHPTTFINPLPPFSQRSWE